MGLLFKLSLSFWRWLWCFPQNKDSATWYRRCLQLWTPVSFSPDFNTTMRSCCYQLYGGGHSVLDLTACIHSKIWYLLHPEYSSLLFKGQPDHPLLSELFQNLQWSLNFHINQNTLHVGSYPETLCWWSLRLSMSNESASIRLVPHQEHPCLMTHNT